jgi:hypothetical protein
MRVLQWFQLQVCLGGVRQSLTVAPAAFYFLFDVFPPGSFAQSVPTKRYPGREPHPGKTIGVDAQVTSGRIVLLDVQANTISKSVHHITIPGFTVGEKHEFVRRPRYSDNIGSLDLLNVQICAWLITVSDIILLLGEEHLDREIIHCLRLAYFVAQKSPNVGHLATTGTGPGYLLEIVSD